MLTLRLVPKRRKKKAVQWAEDVVDNELLDKKKSKSAPELVLASKASCITHGNSYLCVQNAVCSTSKWNLGTGAMRRKTVIQSASTAGLAVDRQLLFCSG